MSLAPASFGLVKLLATIEVLHGSNAAFMAGTIVFFLWENNLLSNDSHCSCHEKWLPCKASIVQPPLTATSTKATFFSRRTIHTFTLTLDSTTSNTPQRQQRLKHFPTGKITSPQRPVLYTGQCILIAKCKKSAILIRTFRRWSMCLFVSVYR